MDNTFKKMLLVNPDTVKQTDVTRSIVEKKLSNLDKDMNDILNSDLAEDEKAKRYTNILRSYKCFIKPKPKHVDPDSEILKHVHNSQKVRAKELLTLLKPYLAWNEDGEIIVGDRVVPFSNLTYLINELMKPTDKRYDSVAGWEELKDTINMANIPHYLIPNKRRWEATRGTSRSMIPVARRRRQQRSQSTAASFAWDSS